MVFGWGSPRKAAAEPSISQEEANNLFARLASGVGCTPSEGEGAAKDAAGSAAPDLTSPAGVSQSNMMPNPNQQRAANQRCVVRRVSRTSLSAPLSAWR